MTQTQRPAPHPERVLMYKTNTAEQSSAARTGIE